ncbi:MAG: hypothetical protein AAF642_09485 [Pseudomonadota bacterium]
MKPLAFAKILESYADLQKSLGAEDSARRTRELGEIFRSTKITTVKAALSSIHLVIDPSKSPKFLGKSVGEAVKPLADLEKFLPGVATAAKRTPLTLFLGFARDFDRMDWTAFTSDLRRAFGASPNDIAEFYVKRLSDTYRDPRTFQKVYDALKNDKRVSPAIMKKIAVEFTGHKVTGAKAKLLDWIWKKHSYYESGSAASKAMAGKSAA